MNFSLTYLGWMLLKRIRDFFIDWYLNSFIFTAHAVINFLKRLDSVFAWRITLRNFFEPLFQDHSVVGHVLALIFRSFRLLIASLVYAAIILLALTLYLIWILIPVFIIYSGFS